MSWPVSPAASAACRPSISVAACQFRTATKTNPSTGRRAEGLAEVKALHPAFRPAIEPGRYLVAESGVLLTHATQVVERTACAVSAWTPA